MEWQSIETVPDQLAVDVWIKSEHNEEFGVRVTSVHRMGSKWFGVPDYYKINGVYISNWMPLPPPPKE